MRFLSIVGNSLGCSSSGERLVSAARDGDLQEAKALLDDNPRLVRYLTIGVRNSPLHYSAAQGHHEIVSLLIESGVDINLRNYRGQTALMQACQHGHWEVVQTLILYRANIHRADYLNGGTALHLAALNGHTRCIRLLLADYIPSIPNLWSLLQKKSKREESISDFNDSALYEVVNKPADGGITALHMAALNGHFETVQFLLDLGASVTDTTVEDGTIIDLIGAGSSPLHYAACGGNAQCCQILIARGASLSAQNANGWTPLMVAQSWNRDRLEEILCAHQEFRSPIVPSPYLSLPFLSIVKIARECGWRSCDSVYTCQDPCVVCLERKCTVAAEGCDHEFCTRCGLYLCSMSTASAAAKGPPGSIPCPLCRDGIISFVKLPGTRPKMKEMARTTLSLSFCAFSSERPDRGQLTTPLCMPSGNATQVSPLGSSFRSLSSVRFNSSLCMGAPESPTTGGGSVNRSSRNQFGRCSRSSLRRTSSASGTEGRRSWFGSSRNHYVTTGSGG
ncbi:E3 ubiquitin-protein ligase xbat32 [Ancistrocladus abbreviatus]